MRMISIDLFALKTLREKFRLEGLAIMVAWRFTENRRLLWAGTLYLYNIYIINLERRIYDR